MSGVGKSLGHEAALGVDKISRQAILKLKGAENLEPCRSLSINVFKSLQYLVAFRFLIPG